MTWVERQPLAAALWLMLVGALFSLGSAWFFQLVLKLEPCPLCLQQRQGYYAALLVAPLSLWLSGQGRQNLARFGLMIVMGLMAYTLCLAVYHAGAEWKFWAGPAACSGSALPQVGSVDMRKALSGPKIVSCTEVQWRLFGLSMAGYNALISGSLLVLMGLGLWADVKRKL